jgi:heme/copper-type cytochrome/quinol oxidase subunit 4
LKQFYDFMIMILLTATAVSFAIGDYIEAGVILLVVLTNVVIGFVQVFCFDHIFFILLGMQGRKSYASSAVFDSSKSYCHSPWRHESY